MGPSLIRDADKGGHVFWRTKERPPRKFFWNFLDFCIWKLRIRSPRFFGSIPFGTDLSKNLIRLDLSWSSTMNSKPFKFWSLIWDTVCGRCVFSQSTTYDSPWVFSPGLLWKLLQNLQRMFKHFFRQVSVETFARSSGVLKHFSS